MNSAAEARFRIQAVTSYRRAVRVIALDMPGEDVVRRLAKGGWEHTSFLSARQEMLHDLAGQPRNLIDEVDTADLVVMIAAPGGRAYTASMIGEACSARRVMTTGLIVGGISAPEGDVSKTLMQLRPWSLMVVIADADDYIDHMLAALRG
jgi:hypothetical protein